MSVTFFFFRFLLADRATGFSFLTVRDYFVVVFELENEAKESRVRNERFADVVAAARPFVNGAPLHLAARVGTSAVFTKWQTGAPSRERGKPSVLYIFFFLTSLFIMTKGKRERSSS